MNKIVYIIVLLLFISCESKTKYKQPENLISREQMIDLLTDIHIAVGTKGIAEMGNEREIDFMSLVYDKYNIDSTRFAESNFYYYSNIEEYELMFKEVEMRLLEIQKEYGKREDTLDMDSYEIYKSKQRRIGKDDIVK